METNTHEVTTQRIQFSGTPLATCNQVFEMYHKGDAHLSAFLTIMARVFQTSRGTFAFSNVQMNAKAFEVPGRLLAEWYLEYCKLLTLMRAIEPLASIDETVFQIL
jgi:hypothetical protein